MGLAGKRRWAIGCGSSTPYVALQQRLAVARNTRRRQTLPGRLLSQAWSSSVRVKSQSDAVIAVRCSCGLGHTRYAGRQMRSPQRHSPRRTVAAWSPHRRGRPLIARYAIVNPWHRIAALSCDFPFRVPRLSSRKHVEVFGPGFPRGSAASMRADRARCAAPRPCLLCYASLRSPDEARARAAARAYMGEKRVKRRSCVDPRLSASSHSGSEASPRAHGAIGRAREQRDAPIFAVGW